MTISVIFSFIVKDDSRRCPRRHIDFAGAIDDDFAAADIERRQMTRRLPAHECSLRAMQCIFPNDIRRRKRSTQFQLVE